QRPIGQPLRQALALDEAHAEVVLPLVLADLEDRDDPGVIQIRRRFGLGVEALDVGLMSKLAGEDHLERHLAVEAHLPGLEDHGHAPAGQLASDRVVAEIAEWVGNTGSDDGDDPSSTVASYPGGRVASS